MKNRRYLLKIDLAVSMAESKICRAMCETATHNGGVRESITSRRVIGVRQNARLLHLAGCALRGTPYQMAEASTASRPNLDRIGELVEAYGVCYDTWMEWENSVAFKSRQAAQREAWAAWRAGAESHLESLGLGVPVRVAA